jgi:hypothetical protein
MAIQVTCGCGQRFMVPEDGLPRPIACHNCGGRMLLTEPDRVEWAPGAEGIRTEAGPRPSARPISSPAGTPEVCPDCGGTFARVKIIARGSENPISGAAIDTEVKLYAEADAQRSTWLRMFTPAGRVRALMCQSCCRIFLYGSRGT